MGRENAVAISAFQGDVDARLESIEGQLERLRQQQHVDDIARKRLDEDMRAAVAGIRNGMAQSEAELLQRLQVCFLGTLADVIKHTLTSSSAAAVMCPRWTPRLCCDVP
jgi:hypothetical protein